jgi:hypothetical protein
LSELAPGEKPPGVDGPLRRIGLLQLGGHRPGGQRTSYEAARSAARSRR